MNGVKPIRTLTFSTLFPNREQPAHGIFVWQRLRHLLATGRVETRVLAPVAWFPARSKQFGSYGRLARVPEDEIRDDVNVQHPRYALVPKIGMTIAPVLLAYGVKHRVASLLASGFDFDLIDAHYYYPDGVAAMMLGKWFRKPVVITARGTDINLIPRYRLARAQILWAANNSAASITVCEALRDEMLALGVPPEKVTVLRNGVDLQLFRPCDRDAVRERLSWRGRILLSVGLLIERKGHHLIVDMLRHLPADYSLVIVGEGPMRGSLQRQIAEAGLGGRVHLLGARNQAELVELYGAADALVLASSREGMANVLLESIACGTPLIATRAWGTPEVVRGAAAGVLAPERTPESLAEACRTLFAHYPDRAATRTYAETFSWSATTQGQLDLFNRVLGTAS